MTAHRGVGKNDWRWRYRNPNAGEGGASTRGGGHSAPGGGREERQRLGSVRGRSTTEARGGEGA
jgi:hypothetical protein